MGGGLYNVAFLRAMYIYVWGGGGVYIMLLF